MNACDLVRLRALGAGYDLEGAPIRCNWFPFGELHELQLVHATVLVLPEQHPNLDSIHVSHSPFNGQIPLPLVEGALVPRNVEDQVSSVWILWLYMPISDISCDLLAGGPQRSDHRQ